MEKLLSIGMREALRIGVETWHALSVRQYNSNKIGYWKMILQIEIAG